MFFTIHTQIKPIERKTHRELVHITTYLLLGFIPIYRKINVVSVGVYSNEQ